MESNALVPATISDSLIKSPDTAALRAIAIYEAGKGVLVFGAGIGLMFFLHHNLVVSMVDLIRHMRLDPASRVPHMLVEFARSAEGIDPRIIAGLALLYTAIRFAEAYGLWFDRAWGEWIGALSGGIYLPFEAHEAIFRPSWLHAILLLANLFIVLFLVFHLWKRKHHSYRVPVEN
jgi:uncharacterized membrane protein (DUF2068 family)